ncbi:hypothetical protein BC937DRAFT_89061 [Endogone sp. FLAS-F59071]|nr:hypothetical protein BC937DRAFT_89061 [Endogone sp. FLAS-F59071]|eukprot:RUS22454.1 hypothetical protein BC937DRAFT_89061 [Endogone sp. FLAS-F59071]
MFKQINAFSKNISSSVLKSYSHISGSTSTPNLFSTSISTSSSISSSATEPDASPPTSFSQETIELWIADTQRGIDALFDDNFVGAEDIFLQHLNESPFHAVGYALMGYIEAMLGFEPEKIQIATERLAHAEHLAHGFAKSASKESWLSHLKLSLRNGKDKGEKDVTSLSSPSSQPIHPASTRTSPASALPISAPSFPAASSSIVQNKSKNTPGLEYELLEANCILMSATIQFLRESWIDYMKAAYKLRKSYKMFDSMFSAVTGKSTSEYATELKRERKRNPPPRQHCRQSNTSSHYSSGSSSSGVSLPGSRPISVLQTPKTNNFSRKDSIQQTLDRLTSLPSNGSSPAPSPSTSSLSQNDFSSLTKQENIQQTLNILTASTESTIIYPYILAATPLHPFTTETFVNPGPSPSSSLASSPPTSSPSSSSPSSPIISTQPHSGSHFVPNPDDDFPFDTAQPTFPFKKTSKAAGRQSLWSVSSGAPLASAGASDSTHRKKMSKQEKRKSMPVFSSTSSTATLLYPPPPDPGTPSGLTEEGVMFGVGLFSLIFSLLPPRSEFNYFIYFFEISKSTFAR